MTTLTPSQAIDPSFTSIFGRHFHVVQGNEEVQKARIIFVGNCHYREEQQWRISWLVQQLYQKHTDIVFSESPYDNPNWCDEIQYATIPLRLRGWDSKTRLKELEQKKHLVDILLHIDQVRRHGLGGDNWIEELKKLDELFSIFKVPSIFKAPSSPDDLSLRLSSDLSSDVSRNQPSPKTNQENEEVEENKKVEENEEIVDSPQARMETFNYFVKQLSEACIENLQQYLLYDLFSERNTCMLQKIDTALAASLTASANTPSMDSSRIFVIAGISHLTWDPRFSNTSFHSPSTIESVKEIHAWGLDKKYVILYPNENSDLNEVKDVLDPSFGAIFRAAKGKFRDALKEKKCCKFLKLALVCTAFALCILAVSVCISPVALPYLGYRKIKKCCASCSRHHRRGSREFYQESLKDLPIEDLIFLIGHAANFPNSLPTQVGLRPLEQARAKIRRKTTNPGDATSHERKDAVTEEYDEEHYEEHYEEHVSADTIVDMDPRLADTDVRLSIPLNITISDDVTIVTQTIEKHAEPDHQAS